VDAVKFLERFTPWDEVESELEEYADCKWTSLDHNKFYAAVEWFAFSEASYLVNWTY
jgi:hypothetical protein